VVGSSPLSGENNPDEELAETVDARGGYATYVGQRVGLELRHSL